MTQEDTGTIMADPDEDETPIDPDDLAEGQPDDTRDNDPADDDVSPV